MESNFDTPHDRREVPALKMHKMVLGEDGEGLFVAGVADMDFEVAPPILAALHQRLEHGIFGYEAVPDGLTPALTDWLRTRHGWQVDPTHILRAPNALNSLAIAASLFSHPGDGIIVQPPVFFDFFDVIRENGRKVVENPLVQTGNHYGIDFDGLEALAASPLNGILFLCNPHNPVGRVWTRTELTRLAEICLRHGVLVVADELHADITFSGHGHTPFASLGPEHAANSITILSPAKSFNIAACCSAFTVIPDEARRAKFQAENSRLTVNKNNAFANVAMMAAYRDGTPWLDAVVDYIAGNAALVGERLEDVPGITVIPPEGTFLMWLDFRALGLAPDALNAWLRSVPRWAVTSGASFGKAGEGFARLNIACPRPQLAQGLDRLAEALTQRPS